MYNKLVKPTLDKIVALVLLIVLLVPLCVVALIIKLESPGPAIFKQKRSGKNRREFLFYKFRSMTVDAPSDLPTSSFHGSSTHITRFGRLIRRLSIDELPQLVNVLRGDMSIIGYRPLINSGTDSEIIKKRHEAGVTKIKPGITGWAQVNGRDFVDAKTKVELDKYYADNLSFKMDLRVLITSFAAVLTHSGYREGEIEPASIKNVSTEDVMDVA